MFPKSTKNIKLCNITQTKPTKSSENTINNVEEKRDSPEAIINFINKKIHFVSKFDKKGSDEFLLSKDIALCDVILDDEIEEDESDCYNNISFMRKFTFDRGNNPNNDEKNLSGKNQKSNQLNHGVSKQHKLSENNSHLDAIGKNKEKKIRKKL